MTPILPLLGLGAGALALAALAHQARPDAAPAARSPLRFLPSPRGSFGFEGPDLLAPDALASTLARAAAVAEGRPYSWGGGGPGAAYPLGSPGTAGGVGWDCSGFALATLALLGRYPWEGVRLSSAGLANAALPVAEGDQLPGDLAFYTSGTGVSHVVVVLRPPDLLGRSAIVGANGGGPVTNADDPASRVSLKDSHRYRKGFLTFGRLARPVDPEQAAAVRILHALLAGLPVAPLPAALRRPVLTALHRHYGGVGAVRLWLANETTPRRPANA